MKKLLNYFLKGLLIFAPMALTIFAVIYIFTGLDKIFRDLFNITIPGLGLVATIALITLIGFFTSNWLGDKLFTMFEKLFTKLPFVKLLYSSLKDFLEAFAGEKKKFDRPVLVELTPGGPKAMGFITRQNLENLGLKDHVAVYFPQSYNFAGSVLIFESKRVKPLDVESSEAMAFIVSGGITGNTN